MINKKKTEQSISAAKVYAFDTVDSTNTVAKRMIGEGALLPFVICADSQSAGRGRLGRSFYSPRGTGLYMSIAFEAEADMADEVTVTSAAAVAVCQAIDELCQTDCKIKWVNDIYLYGKKVCGILTEAMTAANRVYIIVGIGINCTTELFPEKIRERAGSVGISDREALAALVAEKLFFQRRHLKERLWLSEYRRRSLVLGEKINYTENGKVKQAVAAAIDDNGGLVITENGTERVLSTGEITVRIDK